MLVVLRYGLRTNSLMLLGLCLGWIFGILSFREVENVRFQLSFGLINGLQVSKQYVKSYQEYMVISAILLTL